MVKGNRGMKNGEKFNNRRRLLTGSSHEKALIKGFLRRFCAPFTTAIVCRVR